MNFSPIKIVALDLDGTLLDSSKHLSPRNKSALERVADSGIAVVPTTGRFFAGMPQEVRDLPFIRYAITVNGANVFDRVEDVVISSAEIDAETAISIMKTLDEFDVIYDCYQDNKGWMTESMQEKAALYAPDEHYLKMIRELRRPVPDLKDRIADIGTGVQKVMCFARNPDDLPAIRAAVSGKHPSLALTQSTPNNVEINDSFANKGEALRRLAAALGVSVAECMAFGDGLNDLTMIQAAGTGVAMANACQEVLAAADVVTLSNDDDGVAAVLEKIVEKQS